MDINPSNNADGHPIDSTEADTTFAPVATGEVDNTNMDNESESNRLSGWTNKKELLDDATAANFMSSQDASKCNITVDTTTRTTLSVKTATKVSALIGTLANLIDGPEHNIQ